MTTKKEKLICELVNTITSSENQLLRLVGTLKNAGNECNCDESERYDYLHYGEWTEVMSVCLNCGGYIENEM